MFLNALSKAGQSSFAASISSTFIQNAYTFNNDPSALTSARFAMGELLSGLAIPPPILASPANGGTGFPLMPALVWNASAGATSYDVYFGTSSTPPLVTNVTTTSYSPTALAAGTTYYWQIVARNTAGTAASPVWSFTTNRQPSRRAESAPRPAARSTQTFTFTFTDPRVLRDLSVLDVLISTFLDGQTACYFALAPTGATTGYIYLVDDAGDGGYAGSPMPLPSASIVQNSQCTISGTGSSVSASGNTLTLTLAITFKPAFGGNKAVYMAARSNTQNSGWQVVGDVGCARHGAGGSGGGRSIAGAKHVAGSDVHVHVHRFERLFGFICAGYFNQQRPDRQSTRAISRTFRPLRPTAICIWWTMRGTAAMRRGRPSGCRRAERIAEQPVRHQHGGRVPRRPAATR